MDKTIEHSIDYKNISISKQEIGKIIGYSASEIPEMIKQQIHDIQKEIEKYCQIKGGYRRFNNIQIEGDSFILEGITFHSDRIISSSLKQIDSIAVFVCTAGEKLSHWINHLFKNEYPIKAYIADIIASLIVEKATDHLQETLEDLVKSEQKQITNRYSPGFCGWDVTEQHQLLSLLPKMFCNISLNEAALMNPIKSVSGIIGIGVNAKKTAYQCNKCEKKDCLLANKQ